MKQWLDYFKTKKVNVTAESTTSNTELKRVLPSIPEDITGLFEAEIKERYEKGQYNKKAERLSRTTVQIVRENSLTLFNFINLFLAVAVFLVGYPKNALFFWIIIVNTAIGVLQEIHAKRTIDQLSLVNETMVTVVREKTIARIRQEEIVLGDILYLIAGNQVPSDAKVIYTEGVEVDESLLTGEADMIDKDIGDPLMSGSFITVGVVYAKVTSVGEDNFIAKLSKEAKGEKPSISELVKALKLLIKGLTFAIIPIGSLLFWTQYLSTQSIPKSVLGVAGALISMIPEGLMLLTSVAFAVGAANLAKRQTLIQRLPSIETLARVDTICLDKTGTITDGTLTFEKLLVEKPFSQEDVETILMQLMEGLSDQNATAQILRETFSLKQEKWAVKTAIPFSPVRKWSGVNFFDKGSYVIGAPEFIYLKMPEKIKELVQSYSQQGHRVLVLVGFSDSLTEAVLPESVETLALLILSDTIRKNAKDTFSYFEHEDVTLKVISGDNPVTVSHIAKKAGIQHAEQFVDMSQTEENVDYQKLVEETTVFGRVTPYQKRELIRALRSNGHTTCMTGDGVNDILSLREADVSVAMASGSDAARALSDVILLNSDFSSMIQVLHEGRRVINNIERIASMYMVKTIYSIILAVTFIFVALPYPFAPLQLTPINALTVGIPSFVLALKPSYERIKGHFLTNILRISVPGALTVVVSILFLQVAGVWFDLSHAEVSTMCVLLTGCVGFQVLVRVARPLDQKRRLMVVVLLIAFIGSFLFFGHFFMYTTLFSRNILFYLPLILGSRAIFNYMSLVMNRVVYQWQKKWLNK